MRSFTSDAGLIGQYATRKLAVQALILYITSFIVNTMAHRIREQTVKQ